jgi:Protein of unknown function (DUF2764)
MKRYFYLAASLPELGLDFKPNITFNDFIEDAKTYLKKEDYEFVTIIRELIDIENIRRLLLEQSIDDRGNLTETALDEAVLGKVDLPSYAVDFLDNFSDTKSRLDNFASLYAGFFSFYKNTKNSSLNQYLSFEHELRLWIALLRAQKMGQDFSQALQFEDSKDSLIMSMLVQNQNPDLSIPDEFKKLKSIFESFSANPVTLQKKIEEFRLNKIDELVQDKFFSIDVILGFIAKLLIIEQWQSLNHEEGLNRLNRFYSKH